MNLKCFHELDCPELEEIQQQSLAHLTEIYNFDDQQSLNTDLWLKIDYKSLIKATPALVKWTRDLGLFIREVALTVVNYTGKVELHIDEPPTTAKINIPIMNYEGVTNEWYSVPDDVKQLYTPEISRFGNEFWKFKDIDLSKCTLLDSVILSKPIVFNSQIPHCVRIPDTAKLPRIVMPVMFYHEPIDYLKL